MASGVGWRRRVKQFIGLHLRQVPCLSAVVDNIPSTLRFWRQPRYDTLPPDEEGDGVEIEDRRQSANVGLGKVLVKGAMLCMVGITVLLVVTSSTTSPDAELSEQVTEEAKWEEFKRDSPIVLYLGALELLICGACAQTAATMYTRRRHALQHPKDGDARHRARYIQVHLEKDMSRRGAQLYGLGFRPGSDGLECLLVEDVRPGSLLDLWNAKQLTPSLVALGDAASQGDGAADGDLRAAASPDSEAVATVWRPPERVHPGAAVVAVNHVTADVGLMQAELTKAAVTLWVRSEVYHPSQLESEVLAEPDAVLVAGRGGIEPAPFSELHLQAQHQAGTTPGPTLFGTASNGADLDSVQAMVEPEAISGPLCACVSLEDEEPQILMRWLVCSLLFGWVTLLPVILMQPHEERPRQHLFRQYLLKPCVLIMPLWIVFWLLDCIEIFFKFQIIRPFWYFLIVHMIFPAVLAWYLMQLQAADERLVMEQRQSRKAELEKEGSILQPVAVEDPSPTLLREFISVNPVALVWLGSVASIPIVLSSFFTPMKTERARLAQGFVNMIYTPLIFLQITFFQVLHQVRFIELPRLYLAAIGLLLSLPCFMIWCICLMCASRYGRQDQSLVQRQRVDRARDVFEASRPSAAEAGSGGEARPPDADLVDLTEARQREWEFIFTA